MKISLYARVSTTDKDQNPENQLHTLRQWANQLGHIVSEEYIDFASGGDSNRPSFKKLRMDARQNKFNGILVWSLDRFSREGILNTMEYLRDLNRYNVWVKAYQDQWLNTEDSLTRDLLISIFSWVGSFEKKRISDRIKADIARRKALGVYKGGRPRKTLTEEDVKNMNEWLAKPVSVGYVAKRFKISRGVVKEYYEKIKTPPPNLSLEEGEGSK